MGALPTSEPVAFRFAPYIKELREFLAVSHLRYGSPEDIFPVTERLQTSREFAEDMSSMVRAILLREGGSMAHAQLLEILAIAIGGPAMDHAPQDYRQPLRQLLSFLTGVLRRPWNLPPGEEAEPDSPESVASYSADSGTFDHASVVAFPSGPFATAAALSAAEQRSSDRPAADRVPREPEPEAIRTFPKAQRAPHIETAPMPVDTTAPASAAERLPVPEPESPPLEPEYVETQPVETQPVEVQSADYESLDAIEPAAACAAAAEAEVAAVAAHPFPVPVEMHAIEPFSPAAEVERASAPLAPAASDPEPAAAIEHDPVPVGAAQSASAASATPAVAALAASVAASAHSPRRIHGLSSSPWRDSPFDDSYPDGEALREPDVPPTPSHSAAAPWVSQAADSRTRPPWISPSVRNSLLIGAAAIVVAVVVAIVLRPTAPRDDTNSAVESRNAPAAAANPAPGSTAAVNTSTPVSGPTPSATVATSQQQPTPRRARARSDDDEDYTGKDVAPPTYRSFITPVTASTSSPSSSQTTTSASSSQAASSTQAPAAASAAETASEDHHAVAGGPPGVHQFRNPDATLAGDPRPTRPGARTLSGEPTFRVSSGMMAANLISAPNPDYPTLARITHVQGEVILQAVISRDGHVSATHVLSGHRLLRGAAVDAVKRWRYRPYIANGHPVDVATVIRVDFRSHE